MGAEASCVLRMKGSRHTGRALIETDDLIFRGDDVRLKLPLASLRDVQASDGKLSFVAESVPVTLELGSVAERWAERIRNPKTLFDKLDLKPSHNVAVLGFSDAAFVKGLEDRVASVVEKRIPRGADVVFLATEGPQALVKLASIVKSIARDGAIWVVHPKGAASRVKDTDVFMAAKKVGLTATKVARFSETHTAEKLVIPIAKR